MMRNLVYILIVFLFTFCKQEKHRNYLFNFQLDSMNILNMRSTMFLYKDAPVYEMNIPKPYMYAGFPKSNYIIIDGKSIKSIMLLSKCLDVYKSGKFKFIENVSEVSLKELNDCDVFITPFLNLNMKVGDKEKYYTDHELFLENKFYDDQIADSVYKFRRQWRDVEKNTIILFSQKKGIIGLYDTLLTTKVVYRFFNPHGKIYIDRGKEFTREDLVKPSIDLRKVTGFQVNN